MLACTPPERLKGDALRAHADWLEAGGAAQPFVAGALAGAEVIVDGLLGTGLTGAPRTETMEVIRAINAANLAVLALDLPSGLDADSGAVRGAAVRADVTVSFVALKSGLYLGAGPEHAGVVLLEDLGVVPPALPGFEPLLRRIDEADIATHLPRRARESHKGTHGRVLIIGGGPGMPGALRLAGEAALRAGAGLVTAAGLPGNLLPVTATRPELIYLPLEDGAVLAESWHGASVIAIGPGLGQDRWAREVWRRVLDVQGIPVVMDADALNLLALAPAKLAADWILTPHPGEAARLLATDTQAIQADRLGAVRELHARYGAVVVLKGAGSLVSATENGVTSIGLCDRGNPGMATAGMGDVLTGVIAGLVAQLGAQPGASALAARLGVLIHALAGDAAAQGGQRGLIASDVIGELWRWVNP